jgi:flavodoxin
MNIFVAYDSQFGNTQQVAEGIGQVLAKKHQVTVQHIGDTSPQKLGAVDLLFLGTPTHGGQATPNMNMFISQIVAQKLPIKVACFDTRFSPQRVGLGLKLLMSVIDYASPKMAKNLEKNTAGTVLGFEGFIVTDKEGPLASGELQRAQQWAQDMVALTSKS